MRASLVRVCLTGVGIFYWCGFVLLVWGFFTGVGLFHWDHLASPEHSHGVAQSPGQGEPPTPAPTMNGLDWRNPTQLRFFWALATLE